MRNTSPTPSTLERVVATQPKPFARGYGILVGVAVLWGLWLIIFWIGKAIFFGDAEAPVE